MPAKPGSVGLLAAAALLLTGCWSSAGDEGVTQEPTRPVPSVAQYVALGDSYTAAPFVPDTQLAEGCFRSDGNYPSLLAEELGVERFTDVSCSAATTADLTGQQATAGGRGRVPAQLRVLDRGTDLVTVGIGANDEDLFARLISCVTAGDEVGCDEALASSRAVLARTEDRVAQALAAIEQRAPRARVVLVGYPRLVDPASPCPLLPAPEDRLADLARVERTLDRALQAAARSTGADYLDLHAASVGHEVCSSDPWVNGPTTDESAALAFHPFTTGQEAVAERVLELLEGASR
jgi:lysophospholipase L1-like esterase